jgi:putative transcriptional regulator
MSFVIAMASMARLSFGGSRRWAYGIARSRLDLIGSIRRDYLDHVVIFGEQHLIAFEVGNSKSRRTALMEPRAANRVRTMTKTALSCSARSRSHCWPLPRRCGASECGSSQHGLPNQRGNDATMKKTVKQPPKIDWSRADAMTTKQRRATAKGDPDNRPMTDEEWSAAPRVPQIRVIRRALKLSQEEFAASFQIPIGTLRDWEQGRKEPDAAARAYLRVIAREPDTVRRALTLARRPPVQRSS